LEVSRLQNNTLQRNKAAFCRQLLPIRIKRNRRYRQIKENYSQIDSRKI